MQQPVVTQPSLLTEAKMVKGGQTPANAETKTISGQVAVADVDAVYLDLSASRVAMAVREGNDLVLTDVDGQVLRLAGFYEGGVERKLFLENDDDRSVLLETVATSDGPLALTYAATGELSPFEGKTSDDATVVAGADLGAAAGGLLGLALAGGLALAAGGGGGGGGGDGDLRRTVDATPPATPSNLRFDVTGGSLSGSGEAGATVTVRNAAGATIGTGQVNADGTFSIPLNPPLIDREQVSVTLTDAAGNASGPGAATAPDLTAPTTPTDVDVSDTGSAVTGRGEAGAAVTVRNAAGDVIGTGVVASGGNFNVTLTPALTNGEQVQVVLTDASGNVSRPGAATAPDLTAPAAPSDVDVSDTGAVVIGRGEAGAAVTVRNAAGSVLGAGVVDAGGAFSVSLTPALTNGEPVEVILTDAAGNTSDPSTAQAPDLTAPTAPVGIEVSPSGDLITGVGEAGATVSAMGPDGAVIGVGQVGADGRFTIPLTTPLIDSEVITVSQADLAGNVSPEATVVAPDLTFPGGPNGTDAPVVLIGEAQGGVNAAELSDGVQARVQLTPGSQAGDRVILTAVSGGAPVVVEHVLLGSEILAGVAEVVLPATLTDGAYGVSAIITDGRGNTSQVSPTLNILVDTVTPAPVVQTANGLGLSGTAEAGAVVTLVNAQGVAVVGVGGAPVMVTAGPDGVWTLPGALVPGGLDGFVGGVRSVDAAGNTAQTGVGPVDGSTPAPVITAQNGLVIEGTAEAGAQLSLLDADGDPVLGADGQPITVVVDPVGGWSIPGTALTGGLDGFSGSVQAVDPAGNTAASPVGPIDGTIDLSLNIDAVTADNVINIAEAGAAAVTVTGRAIGEFVAGQTVTVTLSNGAVQTGTVAFNGRWSVNFAGSDLAASSSLTASTPTTDDAGNSITVTDTQAFGLDLTPPLAPVITGANGQGLSGTGEAGMTLNLLNASGGIIATTVVGQDGRWSIPSASIPAALNGFSGSVQTVDAAGNTAAALVGPVDGLTDPPVVTSANGQALTGTGEAGAVISFFGTDGEALVGAGGQPVTALVGASGVWSLPGASVPGGLDGFTGTARATDAAGNTATGAVGPIDGQTTAPVITSANGQGLAGTAEIGAVISLLDANGLPRLDASGNPVRAVAGLDGGWSIPAPSVPGGLDGFTGRVVATDAAGNAASTAVGPVDGSATLSLVVDGVTADNVLNGAEAGQALVTVTGSAAGDARLGDEVRVELSTGVFRTVTVGAGGVWSAAFTGAELAAGVSVTATSTATDAAGNPATALTVQNYRVDLDTVAPDITIANGAGLSGTAEPGATITVLSAGGTVVGSAVADATGVWTIAGSDLSVPIDGFTGTVRATDVAGNTADSPVGPIDGGVDLLLSIDPVTPDNVLNIAEAAGLVTLTGVATGEFSAGDLVTVTLSNGVQQTAALGADGRWSVSFSGADIAASNEVTASISTLDDSGNPATVVQERAFGQDLTAPPAPVVTSAGVGGLVGTGEAGSTIFLSTTAGASVIGSSGQPVTAIVGSGGGWTIPASAFPGGAVPTEFSGRVVAVDASGNPSTPTVIAPIDVTPPNDSTTSLTIDVIAGDDIVNLAESQASVTITGLVAGEFRAGDAVTVTAGAAVYSGTVGADGRWSVATNGAALTGGSLVATVRATDAAGNVGTITGTRAYTQDLVGPGGAGGSQAPGVSIPDAADGRVNPVEFADGVSAVVALTAATQVGDTVVLTLTSGGVSQTFTTVVTQAARDAGQVSLAVESSLADGGRYTTTAVIRDPAGNASAAGTAPAFDVDTIPIAVAATTVSLSEAALGAPVTGTLAVTGASGAVAYALQAPAGTFTSGGQTITWAVEAGGALVGSVGGQAVVRATISTSGAYSISLLGPLDHPAAGADSLQLPIGVTVSDAGGSAQAVIGVNVADTTPTLAAPTTLAPTQPSVIVGDFVESFGPDGGALSSVTIDGRTFAYNPATGAVTTTGASASIVAYSVSNGVLSATTLRGEAISVNFINGDYRVEVTGQDASLPDSVTPDVALGGVNGLLGLVDANALGLIQLGQQQFFAASDANNDVSVVTLRYSVAANILNPPARFSVNQALAAELGLAVSVATDDVLLSDASIVTIRAIGGGAIDNLKLNEMLGSVTLGTGGLGALLSLSLGQTLSIQALDLAGNTTAASESNLLNLGVLANLLGSSPPSQIIAGSGADNVITASDVGSGTALDNRLYGYGGNDTLNAGLGNDILRGGAGNDILDGGAGNDLLIGGTANDRLTGGSGVDLFRWERGDQGVVGAPAADTIVDFNVASVTLGGDVLDLSNLLIGEGRIGLNPANLTNFIHFEQTASGTLIHISTSGGFVGGYGSATSTGGAGDQTILLSNVNLTSGFASDQAILTDLLARGKLIVDSLALDGSTAPNTLVIGATGRDGDGDTGSTNLTIDSSNLAPRPPVAGNSAPVVELNAQNLLAVISLGSGLTMGNQDLLAADVDNNLARVELEYAPLVAVNLTPLTFGFSAALATAYGLDVRVTQSVGLLGIVAPSARISIGALDGGALDNVAVNRFLESVYLADTGGGLLTSSLLSVDLLNALTITATDTEGLSSSQVVSSVVSLGALNSLDGPDPAAGAPAEAAAAMSSRFASPQEPDADGLIAAKPNDQPLVQPDEDANGKALIEQLLVLPEAEPDLPSARLHGQMEEGGHHGVFQLQMSESEAVAVPGEDAVFWSMDEAAGLAPPGAEAAIADLLNDLDGFEGVGQEVLHLFPAGGGKEGTPLILADADVLNQPLVEDVPNYNLHVPTLPVLEDPALAHHS